MAYDHPPEYPDEDELVDDSPFEDERRTAQREADDYHRQREAEHDHDRDLERDTLDTLGGGP